MDRPSRRAVVPTFFISSSLAAQDIDRVRVGFPVSQVMIVGNDILATSGLEDHCGTGSHVAL